MGLDYNDSLVRSAKQPPYRSLSPLECETFLHAICDEFTGIVELPETPRASVYSYLALHDWDLSETVQRWLERRTEKEEFPSAFLTLDAAGLCTICGETEVKLLSLNACAHAFCQSCWCEYATFSLKEVGSGAIPCPHHSCGVVLDPGALGTLWPILPKPSDDESDMLELASGLTLTSRLGCQIKVTEDLDGLILSLP